MDQFVPLVVCSVLAVLAVLLWGLGVEFPPLPCWDAACSCSMLCSTT
jgi:hypothetical protein